MVFSRMAGWNAYVHEYGQAERADCAFGKSVALIGHCYTQKSVFKHVAQV